MDSRLICICASNQKLQSNQKLEYRVDVDPASSSRPAFKPPREEGRGSR